MNKKDFSALKAGDKVISKRYGISTVEKRIPDFGVVIQPDTIVGKKQLAADSGAEYGTPLLEDSHSEIQLPKSIN